MNNSLSRRRFLNSGTLAAGAAVGAAAGLGVQSVSAQAAPAGKIKIIALNGSPRKDKTTASALALALEAAQGVAPDRIETELVHLVDYNLFASDRVLGDLCLATFKGKVDFVKLEEKLSAPEVRGVLVGSPVHNSSPSALVALFFGQVRHGNDQSGHPILEGKPAGALAVGGGRNGGQENVVNGINTYLFHEKMLLVGTDSGRVGALLWNQKDAAQKESVEADEFGKKLAATLGQRVAKAALAAPAKMLA